MNKQTKLPRRSVPQLNVRSEYAVRRARELARGAGTTTTRVVEDALRAYVLPRHENDAEALRKLQEIARRANKGRPPLDWRAIDQEMYDENGLPK